MDFIPTASTAIMQTHAISPVSFPLVELDEFIRADFMAVRGVSGVRVDQVQKHLTVEVELVAFDRATRRKVYAKERELYREFPDYEFGFLLVDSSRTADDAHGIRPSVQSRKQRTICGANRPVGSHRFGVALDGPVLFGTALR